MYKMTSKSGKRPEKLPRVFIIELPVPGVEHPSFGRYDIMDYTAPSAGTFTKLLCKLCHRHYMPVAVTRRNRCSDQKKKQKKADHLMVIRFSCERATKSSINRGKNDQK